MGVQVLTAQMDDMQNDSTRVAYQLASPSNRAFTARSSNPDLNGYNEERFDTMVRGSTYSPLLSGMGYDIQSQTQSSFEALVKVYTNVDQTESVVYQFGMSKQPSNVIDIDESLGEFKLLPNHSPEIWRTNSVLTV